MPEENEFEDTLPADQEVMAEEDVARLANLAFTAMLWIAALALISALIASNLGHYAISLGSLRG